MTEQTYMDKPTLAQWNELVNAAAGGVRVETGTYIGTGTYGSARRNTLTFDFPPKLLLVQRQGAQQYGTLLALSGNDYVALIYRESNSAIDLVSLAWSGNSVSWWNGNSATYQLNYEGSTYYYLAIG